MTRTSRGSVIRPLAAAIVALATLVGADLQPQTAPAAALPPTAVLGWSPGVSRDVPLAGSITVYFNRAMDRPSVVRAWHLSPSVMGSFHWGETSAGFTPAQPLRPGSYYRLTIDRTARSLNGISLAAPFSVAFSTGDALQVQSNSPSNGTFSVPTNGLIAVTFNHPMVPLAGLESGTRNPADWRVSITPQLRGHGSWLGTSTWVFHPARGLAPSTSYTVTLGHGIRDAWGDALTHDIHWSFRTITPEVYSRSPRNGTQLADPRGPVSVTFNQPMDRASTGRAFSLRVSGVPVPGKITWQGATLIFHPSAQLNSDQSYVATIATSARSANRRATLNKRVRWEFNAAPPPKVVDTDPASGGTAYDQWSPGYPAPPRSDYHYSVMLYFSAPMSKRSLDRHLVISPAVSRMDTWFGGPNQASQFVYGIAGDFKASSVYDITIRGGVHDSFGRLLSAPYTLHFKTARLRPSVALYGMPGTQAISFSAGRVMDAPIQLVNVPRVQYTLVHTTLRALSNLCCGSGLIPPAGQTIRRWTEQTPHELNKVENVGVKIAQQDGTALPQGLYWLGATTSSAIPGLPPGADPPISSEVVVIRNVSTTLKAGANGTLVWVTSEQSGVPLTGARVRLVDYQGNTIASGTTGAHGIRFFRRVTRSRPVNAVVEDRLHFGMALSSWAPSVSSPDVLPPFWWEYQPSSNGTYLYTDRPVYRPGQRVHFRGILWRIRDGVYSLLHRTQAVVQAFNANGRSLYQARLPLDRFGAVQGTFLLPSRAPTGTSNLSVSVPGVTNTFTSFTVAEYRKPEFLTTVTMGHPSYVQRQTLTARVTVKYLFGAPVTHQQVSWVAYAQPQIPHPPGWDEYSFFDWETVWQQASIVDLTTGADSRFGKQVAQGTGTTNGQGRMTIQMPVDLSKEIIDRTLTIEATTTDINHQPVSGRAQTEEHRSALAIGLAAEHQVVPAGQVVGIDVVTVKQDGTPVPDQPLVAKIFKRTYTSKLVQTAPGQSSWEAVPHDTLVDSKNLTTDSQGKARISFTPSEGGEYYVSVEGKDGLGNDAKGSLSVYASAEGFSDWGLSSNTSISVKPDKATYQVGETAHLLVAAPFPKAAALVTIERDNIRKYWVQQLDTNSSTVDVPITMADLPNVYVTVTLYRGQQGDSPPDWRYGTAELHVRVDPKHLMVHLKQTGRQHHPGDWLTYSVTTTDTHGRPVSAEVSLALVDTAALALQDESAPDILKALYSDRSLGVSTASDGVLSIDHLQLKPDFPLHPSGTPVPVPVALPVPGGGLSYGSAKSAAAPQQVAAGGGGCGPSCSPQPALRSRFADTAYWSGNLVTDRSGHAVIQLKLPDNATTWRLDARGLTTSQGVGQGQLRTLATQDLVLRPMTPRFLVEGDTLHVGAVINNNLGRPVGVAVSAAASGLSIRSGGATAVQVPAHGERLVLWPASVPAVTAASTRAVLTFRALPTAPGVRGDAVRLSLPVHPPLTDETVATSGQVFGGMKQLVIVPRNAVASPGALTVQISSSLTAGLGAAYGEFRPRLEESNEDVADRVLAAASLHSLPQPITGLTRSTYRSLPQAIAAGVQKLMDHQFGDGGWPWYTDPSWPQPSDPWITADALQALSASGQRGFLVRQSIARAQTYLRGQLDAAPASERAHLLLVLAQSGSGSGGAAQTLYANSIQRSHLDNGPLAELGRALGLLHAGGNEPASGAARSIVSLLDGRAVVSATGAHWESNAESYWSGPPIAATTQVLGSLLSLNPRDPFVPAAARWLMLARQGISWDCPHDTAQAIAVLAAFARAAREGTADYRYRVMVDNIMRREGRYSGANQRQVSTINVPVRMLKRSGPSTLVVDRQPESGTFGPGPLYYVARLRYYLRADAIAPRSEGVSVGRRYLTLKGQPVRQIAAGSAVQVELTIHTDQTLLYLDVEDPLPVGLEPIDETLNTSQQGLFRPPQFPYFGPGQSGKTQDLRWYLMHSDLHDDRASLYAYYLPPGTYRYTYLAQATVPGRYGVPPTHVSETFFPEVFGRSAGQAFTVR